jgi:transcriptional regulator with XRE-family HTH domain
VTKREDWSTLLREARTAVGLSRSQLADRAEVATTTVKAYELGLRNPTRQLLTRLLDALDCDRYQRNRVLETAGFKPDGLEVWTRTPAFALTLEEARAEINRYRWPALVTGEGLKVIATNAAYAQLFGRRPGTVEDTRGFMAWMSYPALAERLKNWDEVMSFLIGVLKGSMRFPEGIPEGSSNSLRSSLEAFFSGEPRYVRRYLDLWDRTPATIAKARFSYRIVFDHVVLGRLSFRCIGTGVNELDGLIINDWVPEDAQTWEHLTSRQA